MKIALVHDYLREYGGAERVLEALHEMWPEAPVYTSFVDWNSLGNHADRFRNWNIQTSWVQHNIFMKRWHSPLRFLTPKVWQSLDLSMYKVVLSSSSWFMSRGVNQNLMVKTQRSKIRKPVFIDYIHTPPRNMYGYPTGNTLKKYWPVRVYAEIINFFLRHYDFRISQDVDYFIANSWETKRRVWKFYRKESTVIYPPVKIPKLPLTLKLNPAGKFLTKQNNYYLSVGRLMYAKRVDLAIEACNRLKVPLKIVGVGRDEAELKAISGPTIEYLGAVTDEELSRLYINAKALLFTALDEEFGIVPVEAMAHGIPVVGLSQGGVKETIIDGKTGILFSDPTVKSLVDAIRRFEKMKLNPYDSIKHAQKFSKDRFKNEIKKLVNQALE